MAKFTVDEILNKAGKNDPAGLEMQVQLLPLEDIAPNPQNAIYEIGDVGMLKADIAEHGLRTPLEVCPAGGKYMLVAGHRRRTACAELYAEGDKRFALLPCVVREYASEDEELVALITSNATARELTDGERVRQYVALKNAITRLKAAGKVKGRVRDELTQRTGEGAGTLGRLNAISAHCIPEVLEMLEKGEITMTRAYDCSKLYKVQQLQHAQAGWSAMPKLSDEIKKAAIDYLVTGPLAEKLKNLDYVYRDEWSYISDRDVRDDDFPVEVELAGVPLCISHSGYSGFTARQRDPAEPNEVVAESLISWVDMFPAAQKLYINTEALKKYKAREKGKKDAEKSRRAELQHWQEMAKAELARFDEWKKVAQAGQLGLTFREWPTADGGRLVVAVDEFTRTKNPGGLPYAVYFTVRFDADGQRAGEVDYYKRWETGIDLIGTIAEDLSKREAQK
jgi:ParB-like chromosome segregation protein Spo0J